MIFQVRKHIVQIFVFWKELFWTFSQGISNPITTLWKGLSHHFQLDSRCLLGNTVAHFWGKVPDGEKKQKLSKPILNRFSTDTMDTSRGPVLSIYFTAVFPLFHCMVKNKAPHFCQRYTHWMCRVAVIKKSTAEFGQRSCTSWFSNNLSRMNLESANSLKEICRSEE